MACCVLTAYFMSKLIRACEFLDLNIIQIQYNDFDDGPNETKVTGYQRPDKITSSKFVIDGMTCAACVTSIEDAIRGLDGVERVTASLPLSRVTVVHRNISEEDILSVIEGRGYGARIGERTAQQTLQLLEHSEEIREAKSAFSDAATLSSVISGLEWLLRFNIPTWGILIVRLTVPVIATWVQIFDARIVHRNAWRRGLTTSLTMDTLVSLSLILGMALSAFNVSLFGIQTDRVYWSSVSFLTTVVIGGRLLDLILRKESSSTFAKLYHLQEQSSLVKLRGRGGFRNANEEYVDTAALYPGDEIEVNTGMMIPCDGYVLTGESLIDQSTMTGESIPVMKRPAGFLMSGTQNLSAKITMIVLKPQEESALSNLIASISSSTETISSDSKTDFIVSRFVALILMVATVGFIFSLRSRILAGAATSTAVNAACERAMAILASACPCALGLATPSAAMAGLDACGLRGVVIKKGLETLRSIDRLTHVVLDKTGTLTTARLSVVDAENDFDDLKCILLCAAERQHAQNHPVAQTVFQWAFSSLSEQQRQVVNQSMVTYEENTSSNGIGAHIRIPPGDRCYTVHIGSKRFLLDSGTEVPSTPPAKQHHEMVVHVAFDRQYWGLLRLQDTVRSEATAVIDHLATERSLRLAMLTGDVESEAQRVSRVLGIPSLASHSLPLDKSSYVGKIQDEDPESCVAMVGDGLNDAPALAAADVGICLSMGLTSVSASTNSQISDVVLTSPSLARLPEMFQIARKTVEQSKWNIRWAISYNVIAVALAAGVGESFDVVVDVAKAGTMMAFSSISVLAWSLWLRYSLSKVSFEALRKDAKI